VNFAHHDNGGRRVLYVSRNMSGESLRHARAIGALDDVYLLGLAEQAPDTQTEQVFEEVACVLNAHDPSQLITAARELARKHGALDLIVTTQEPLLEAVADAGDALGLQGPGVSRIRQVLDKSCLRSILLRAGINTARGQVITDNNGAIRFADDVGFPIVLKPLRGSGGLATWCVRGPEQLDLALELMQPSFERPVLGEEYLTGREVCIDTITIANEPRCYTACYYRSSILEALENPAIQWSCIMPRDFRASDRGFIEQGLAAVRALSVGNAVTHLEGFLTPRGLCVTDATLRPAGARIGPMLGFAYDVDPYRAWARAAVDGCFDGPWERKYAVGTIFLRGSGKGLVKEVQGFESVESQIGDTLVENRLPRVGAAKSATYTGDGYITVRTGETSAVEEALDFIARTVRVIYSEAESSASVGCVPSDKWKERLQYFEKQIYKPPWESDSMAPASDYITQTH
jgi:hypothetical protein